MVAPEDFWVLVKRTLNSFQVFMFSFIFLTYSSERNFCLRITDLFWRYFNAVYFLRTRCRTSPSIQRGELISLMDLTRMKLYTAFKNKSFQFNQYSSISYEEAFSNCTLAKQFRKPSKSASLWLKTLRVTFLARLKLSLT